MSKINFTKKKGKINLLQFLLIFLVIAVGIKGCHNKQQEPPKDDVQKDSIQEEQEKIDEKIEYDTLQKLFLEFDESISYNQIIDKIKSEGLSYTEHEYNKISTGKILVVKIAYTNESAQQKHSDNGDCIEIGFDLDNDYKMMNMEYCNSKLVGITALYYNYGVWNDFSDNMEGNYSGYYITNALAGVKEEGIKIKYKNGNEVSTHYFKYDTKEDLIKYMYDELNK